MVNSTIAALFAASLSTSPMFAVPIARSSNRLTLTKARFTRHFQNCVASWSPFYNVGLTSCRLEKILAAPIYMSSIEIAAKSVGSRADHSLEALLTITDSHFIKCSGTADGGAIYIRNLDAVVHVSGSVFRQCVTDGNGGAIWSNVLTFECHRSLYKMCGAGISGAYQTIYVNCNENVKLENTVMTKNGRNWEIQGFSTCGIQNGQQNIRLLNSSCNNLAQWGSGLSIHSNRKSTVNLNQCTFYNNSQKQSDIFTFVGVSKECEITDSNIVANICPENGYLISAIARAYVYLRGCVLVKNKVGKLATIDPQSVVLFESCVCDVEQDPHSTVHNIDSIFEKKQFKTIKFVLE